LLRLLVMRKISKKYIEKLTLQEIQAFRENQKEFQITSDYWLCNQIGYINALLFLLNRHKLISLFDEVHNKIRNK